MVTPADQATALCPCASGLRACRCCAADQASWPDQAAVSLLDGQAQDATKLFNEKKYAESEALALKLLDLAPNQRIALRVLFEIRKAQNRGAAAEALARRLASLPGTPAVRGGANTQLAQYLIAQGRHAEAELPAAAAIMATPRDATAHHVMGVVLTETGRLQPGETHYRMALSLLAQEDGLVLANTAWNLKLQGRISEAVALYEKALALRPDNKRGIGGHAQAEFARGNRARAMEILDSGLKKFAPERTLRLLRALCDLAPNPEAVLARLDDAPEALLSAELAARGQALARLDRPAEAVACFAQAKKRQRERQGQSYQFEEFSKKLERYKTYFTSDKIQPLPRAGQAPGPQPVFLLGFPRSGTSLLEQLLAQLPGFAAGDDMAPVESLIPAIPRLTGSDQPYPEALDAALVADGLTAATQLRNRYTAPRLRLFNRAGISFITDRAPSNAWHLGLIKMLFPEAPVIHLLRHPFDVALSNFAQDRKLEANAGISLPAIARHYALTMEMIAHYRGQLTLRYLPLRYEDLVADPAASLARVLDFIGLDRAALPAEPALRANAAKLPEPLPAHLALREPVHAQGAYRHRAYLAAMPNLFNDVRDILTPWIERLGYGDTP